MAPAAWRKPSQLWTGHHLGGTKLAGIWEACTAPECRLIPLTNKDGHEFHLLKALLRWIPPHMLYMVSCLFFCEVQKLMLSRFLSAFVQKQCLIGWWVVAHPTFILLPACLFLTLHLCHRLMTEANQSCIVICLLCPCVCFHASLILFKI